MSKESIRKLAQETVEKLSNELLAPRDKPLNQQQITNKINEFLYNAYTKCPTKEEKRELFKALSLHLHSDHLGTRYPELYTNLNDLGLANLPQQLSKDYSTGKSYHKDTSDDEPEAMPDDEMKKNYANLKTKYIQNDIMKAQNGTIWDFLKYAFKKPSKTLSILSNSVTKNPFLKEIARYPLPLRIFFSFVLIGEGIILGAALIVIAIASAAAQFFLDSYHVITRGLVNLATGGIYKKELYEHINSSGILNEHSKKLKTEALLKLFATPEKDTTKSIIQKALSIDAMNEQEFFEYYVTQEAHFDSLRKYAIERQYEKMEKEVSSFARLKLVFVAYFRAIAKPLDEIHGNGYKFLSVVLIRPLQVISALVFIPAVTFVETVQLAKDLIVYTLSAATIAAYYLSLAILVMPVKGYDLVVALINCCFHSKDSKKSAEYEDAPSFTSGMKGLFESEKSTPDQQPEPQADKEPGNFSSPLKSSKHEATQAPTLDESTSFSPAV